MFRNLLLCWIMTSGAVLAADNWMDTLRRQLPLLGHRNWIVVADSAYPLQTAPGIQTVYADADQLEVVKGVLAELTQVRHVQPSIYLDAEMEYVAEAQAPGMSDYRDALKAVLAGKAMQVLPHDRIIAKLDEAGQSFKVLIIKTRMAKPYTSVFFQLECGYWNAESEMELRRAMDAAL